MALTGILTIPAITKGASNEVQVDKSALALDAKVSGDAYFSDQANWKTILINYQTPTGKQTQVISCDASLATPVGDFNPSLTARDDWEVQSFVIIDHDGGKLEYNRSEMDEADFDIALAAALTVFETMAIGVVNDSVELWSGFGAAMQTVFSGVGWNLDSVTYSMAANAGLPSGDIVAIICPILTYVGGIKTVNPLAPLASSNTFDASTLSGGNGSPAQFIFPSNVVLADNTDYGFILVKQGNFSTNGSTVTVEASNSEAYVGGNAAVAAGLDESVATDYVYDGFLGLDAYLKFN